MRSFAILLLATAVLAAPTQKKDKRNLLLDSLDVSDYALPYSFAGYPTGLFDLGTRIFQGYSPLDNSLVVYPSGLEYEDPLYSGNFGNIVRLNQLALAGFVSDIDTLPLILNSARNNTESNINNQVLNSQSVPQSLSIEALKDYSGVAEPTETSKPVTQQVQNTTGSNT
ncbi:uncharacterized protein LOC109855402 [Pseudomyrmex gracilis]|uniref:uncharacterized protein LOC109855402 n=1 Tax=Pseudomyrmex gracilis TaxID=219809 RepID=UPI0009953280|nr:uncharacterized protein LOC109855402 [Pseudomyrmex gracilis]